MADPITLAVVGGAVLTEGIKFLYGQAGELLKRWRERKADVKQEETTHAQKTEPVDVQLPEVFVGQLSAPKIHYEALAQVADELSSTRKELTEYVEGIKDVNAEDETLTAQVDALRQLIEAVYQQRITFQGEPRAQSGPMVEGRINAREVAGHAAAVRVKKIKGGTVKAEVDVDVVKPGGEAYGIEADEIG